MELIAEFENLLELVIRPVEENEGKSVIAGKKVTVNVLSYNTNNDVVVNDLTALLQG